ncbi:MAG: hypothetical protein KGI00_00180 [Candidatus Micrarchaeota archaeon]|nr:hypothetical protein [Candidatus Micrarchaeota archaeon]
MVQNHFTTHPWRKGEIRWTFSIFPDNNVRNMILAYQKHLDSSVVFAPIPRKWLHMTILQLGDVNSISESEIGRIVEKLRKPCRRIQIPELTAGPWWTWSGSPEIQVTPEPPLRRAFEETLKATRSVLGEKAPEHSGAFIPHISMAYSRDYYKTQRVDKELMKLRIKSVRFRAPYLSLVRQAQTPPFYQWREYEEIELGQAD